MRSEDIGASDAVSRAADEYSGECDGVGSGEAEAAAGVSSGDSDVGVSFCDSVVSVSFGDSVVGVS